MTIIDDNESNPETSVEVEQLELDPESVVDIEDAIREALAAVEQANADGIDQGSTSSPDGESEPQAADLEVEIADLRERSMRTLADFENYRNNSYGTAAERAGLPGVLLTPGFTRWRSEGSCDC